MDNVREFSSRRIIEQEASDWLARLDGDQALSQVERVSLQDWINRSPAHGEELHRLAHFWDSANVLTELSIPLYHQHHSAPVRAGRWQARLAVASVLLISIAIGLTAWLSDKWGKAPASIAGNGVYETRIGEQNTITLADGSVIELNTNSRIQVDYTDRRRSITLLQGEAHFKVSKDPDHPFEVYAGEGRVSAIGTAFVVRLDHQALKVTVTEGKVALAAIKQLSAPDVSLSVSEQPDIPDGMKENVTDLGSLVAGEMVVFEPLKTTSVVDTVEILDEQVLERQLAWRGGMLLFTGDPLKEVISEINRYTTMNIEIVDPAISELRIGGQFKVGETEAMLNVLAVSFNLDVRHVDKNTIQLALKSPVM